MPAYFEQPLNFHRAGTRDVRNAQAQAAALQPLALKPSGATCLKRSVEESTDSQSAYERQLAEVQELNSTITICCPLQNFLLLQHACA